MTLGQILFILRARWRIAVSVMLGIVLTVVGISLVLPRQYTATASLLLDVRPNPISMIGVEGMLMPSFMATQIDILKSERVSRRVVKTLQLNENQKSRDSWMKATEGRGDFEAWMAEILMKGLDIKPARESNVINVNYKASDPRSAAAIANAYVQAYTDTVLDLRVNPAKQYSSFFDARGKQLREQLEKAQAKLSAYQKAKGIVATDERVDVETARLNELSAQMVAIQAITAESGSRQTAAQGRSADQMQDVLLNPLISGLKTSLSVAEGRLQELNARLGDNHPQVIEARANIGALRSRLSQETAKVTSGVTVTNTINRQREAEIRAAYEAQRQRVLQLKQQRDEASGILREVDTAQKAYDSVQARLNQTSLESASNQTNVSVLNPAVEPAEPSSPKLFLNALIGVFLGTMVGIATVLVIEMTNRRVRSIQDVTNTLGVPVIGIMPRPDSRGWMGRNTQPLLARRVLGQLPMPNSRRA